MTINYSWKIIKTKKKDITISIDGIETEFNNAIINIKWEKIGIDSTGVSASAVGLTGMRSSRTIDPNNYIPYENLTKDILVSWIDQRRSDNEKERTDAMISEQIEQKKSIPSITYEFE